MYAPGSSFKRTMVFGSPITFDPVSLTVAMRRNGAVDNSVTVTVANGPNTLGDRILSGTIPSSYAIGDDVELAATFTVSNSPALQIMNLGPLEAPSTPRVVTVSNRSVVVDG